MNRFTRVLGALDTSSDDKPCNPRKPGCSASGNSVLPGGVAESANDWGTLVRSNGRIAVFERDFGRGNRVVTFVIWA